MSKLSLNGVNHLISLLFCDPSKPIYEIRAKQCVQDVGKFPVSVFSNHINVPDEIYDVNIVRLSRVQIGTFLYQLSARFDCASFVPYILFKARLAEVDESLKKKEDGKEG